MMEEGKLKVILLIIVKGRSFHIDYLCPLSTVTPHRSALVPEQPLKCFYYFLLWAIFAHEIVNCSFDPPHLLKKTVHIHLRICGKSQYLHCLVNANTGDDFSVKTHLEQKLHNSRFMASRA